MNKSNEIKLYMNLDPQCRAMLSAMEANGSPFDTNNAAEARDFVARTTEPLPDPDPRFADVEDGQFAAETGGICYRYYRPVNVAKNETPCLVYYHGGGMVFGTLDSHDPICRAIALGVECVVISIDYRLAPEHKFPTAVLDSWTAFLEIISRVKEFGIDPKRIAVGGDSAGGNLAAVVSLIARDMGGVQPCFQWLIYPNTDMSHPDSAPAGGSIDQFADGYFLTRDGLVWIQDQYLNSDADRMDWRASPIKAKTLSGVAPALVQTAGFDPLKDEGASYAARLKEAKVKTELINYPGMIHGFIRAIRLIDEAQTAIDDGVTALRDVFGISVERPSISVGSTNPVEKNKIDTLGAEDNGQCHYGKS